MIRTSWGIALLSMLVAASALAEVAVDYHYGGTVRIDDQTGEIRADWRITVFDASDTEITMLLRDTLSGVRVDGPSVLGVSVEQREGFGNFIATTIRLAAGDDDAPRTIGMHYSGILIPEPMENRINAIEPGRIELNVDSFWHPIDARFNRHLTADFVVELEPGWRGVGYAQIEPVANGYRVTADKPSMDIAFSLSDSFRVTQRDGFTIYDQRGEPGGIDQLVEAAGKCVEFLNQRFGKEQPLPVAELLITERPSSGYSRKSYIALTDIAETRQAPLTRFVCHEFAHNWSYGKFDTVENWINEAFAEYIGLMAVRELLGEGEYQAMLDQFREQVSGQELPRIWKEGDTARGPYLVQYRKAPLALAALEAKIGNALFLQWIQRFFTARGSTTPQLLELLGTTAGAPARQWFEARLGE